MVGKVLDIYVHHAASTIVVIVTGRKVDKILDIYVHHAASTIVVIVTGRKNESSRPCYYSEGMRAQPNHGCTNTSQVSQKVGQPSRTAAQVNMEAATRP